MHQLLHLAERRVTVQNAPIHPIMLYSLGLCGSSGVVNVLIRQLVSGKDLAQCKSWKTAKPTGRILTGATDSLIELWSTGLIIKNNKLFQLFLHKFSMKVLCINYKIIS